ncbi:hypothetical protein SAMN05216276_11089 [Streptosporangium subroseum]|uniref:Aldo/keto reductase family protein n=1 Tax=Streptosporangium subroseum TaxID=106412 RepID=A0A239PAA2_9ACTN|nr:hypothetical protein SAMN05216276_11089 [Streptosporangium subroseum]
MRYVKLGSSGLKVSRICLGMMSYGNPLPSDRRSRAGHGRLQAAVARLAPLVRPGGGWTTAQQMEPGSSSRTKKRRRVDA